MHYQRNIFTEVQLEILKKNPYVKKVTSTNISYTEEFKKLFYAKYQTGVSPKFIFLECGIDPDILGHKRVEGFRYTICKQAEKDASFADHRKNNYRRLPKNPEETLEMRMQQLEHELAYTRQEVEFLKKTHMADMEARKEWESRQKQK